MIAKKKKKVVQTHSQNIYCQLIGQSAVAIYESIASGQTLNMIIAIKRMGDLYTSGVDFLTRGVGSL